MQRYFFRSLATILRESKSLPKLVCYAFHFEVGLAIGRNSSCIWDLLKLLDVLQILRKKSFFSFSYLQGNDVSEDTEGLSKEELGRLVASRWTGSSESKTEGVDVAKDDHGHHEDHEEMPDMHDEEEEYDGYASETDDDSGKYDDVDTEDDTDEAYEEDTHDDTGSSYKPDPEDDLDLSGL